MALRAVFFDVGGTLVDADAQDHWRPIVLRRIAAAFGAQPWIEAVYDTDIRPPAPAEPHRQETNRWLAECMRENGHELDDADVERLREAFGAPLPDTYVLSPGASEALRWCKAHRLTVALLSNTNSRTDQVVRTDFDRFGLGDCIDHAISSYSTGWFKPHPAIFERALRLAGVIAKEACMIGDDLAVDIVGAKDAGLRAVWKTAVALPSDPTVRSDAIVASLAELPGILEPWL